MPEPQLSTTDILGEILDTHVGIKIQAVQYTYGTSWIAALKKQSRKLHVISITFSITFLDTIYVIERTELKSRPYEKSILGEWNVSRQLDLEWGTTPLF
jgi:hypothetical protein